jgi:predicted PurR-regulated permease PerM
MDELYFRKVTTLVILAVLLILSFFLVKPILLAMIGGLIFAFIFSPVYNFLFKLTKSKNFSAILICFVLLSAIIVSLWFFSPMLIDESIKLYRSSQEMDIVTPLKKIFPSLFASQEFSQEVGSVIQSFVTKLTNSLMNYVSNIILDFPTILMQIFVVFFSFFYFLRDKDSLTDYIKSCLPFSKEVEKKLFQSTSDITFSVLYGQLITGIIQGTILGIGLFVFKVPNAFLLSLVGVIAGILPLVGPSIVGVPVAISFFLAGSPVSAIGILLFTVISSFSEQFFRPIFVSKRTKLHPALVLIGMIGGFFFLGILGLVVGPLILAYLAIIIEIYRNKNLPGVLIQETKR